MTDAEKLYVENENLVYFAINKYYGQYQYDEDMRQVGRIALWKVCQVWTPEKGVFSTYAAAAVKHAIEHEWIRANAKKRTCCHWMS